MSNSAAIYRSLNDVIHMQSEIIDNLSQAMHNACFTLYRDRRNNTESTDSNELLINGNNQLVQLIKMDYCQRKLGWIPQNSTMRTFIESYGLDESCESVSHDKRRKLSQNTTCCYERDKKFPVKEMLKYMSLFCFTYNTMVKLDLIKQSWDDALTKDVEDNSDHTETVRYIIHQFLTGFYLF